jgi:hypothetical protein
MRRELSDELVLLAELHCSAKSLPKVLHLFQQWRICMQVDLE